MLDIGSLNRKVTIQSPSTSRDALGQPIDAWTTLATVWANIRHPNGAETIRGDAEVSIVKASIRIRYRTDVTTAMRVMHGSTVYEIKAVLPDAVDKDFVDLVCEVIHA